MLPFMAQLDLLFSQLPNPLSGLMGEGLAVRSNTPSGALNHIMHAGTSWADQNNKLWVVDRILEPQTVVHFVEFAVDGHLPSGRQTTLPLVSEELVDYLAQPLSAWAPPPFDTNQQSTVHSIMVTIGSYEDPSRLVPISKELSSIKSRVWEGVMPLSERRWTELELDSPEQFHEACQYLCAVTNVFHYLNEPNVKKAMRDTYNLIWEHLDTFDKALQAKTASTESSVPSFAALWHEFTKDHFSCISERSHRWVTNHIERLRAPILELLSNETLMDSPPGMQEDQFELADKIHDLVENGAQADSAIFLPMDGYRGESLPSQDDLAVDTSAPYREEPIEFSANTLARKADYYLRVKYLTRIESWTGEEAGQGGSAATVRSQLRAQSRTRAELRGNAEPVVNELWGNYATALIGRGGILNWGYIAYRTCYHHTDDEWETFKKNFEADHSNWGSELQGIDAIRALTKIEWRDAKDFVTGDDDIGSVKRHFESLATDLDDLPFHQDIFLIADRAVIDSYLGSESGQQQGHVLAVDVSYDPSEADPDRAEESPGYEGWLRLLGSLLWDDLGPQLLMQSYHLAELWPMARSDPEKIYRNPLAPTSP